MRNLFFFPPSFSFKTMHLALFVFYFCWHFTFIFSFYRARWETFCPFWRGCQRRWREPSCFRRWCLMNHPSWSPDQEEQRRIKKCVVRLPSWSSFPFFVFLFLFFSVSCYCEHLILPVCLRLLCSIFFFSFSFLFFWSGHLAVAYKVFGGPKRNS